MSTKKEFDAIRGRVFPIHRHELRKFLPMAAIFLLISFCYAITRSLKDMNMIKEAGATAIYWLKMGITPIMVLFTIAYGKVSSLTSRDGRFNAVMIYFLTFFLFSLLFLLPNKEAFKLTSFSIGMTERFPKFLGLWKVIANWPIALFYIHAEAWGTFALSVVFWTFVNEITGVSQAKRFYSFLSMFAAIGSILAGLTLKLDSVRNNFTHGLFFVVAAIGCILLIYHYFTADIRSNPIYYQVEAKPQKKKKLKMTFGESLAFLAKSPYLLLISTLVIGYGLVISLFEAVQKAQLETYALSMKDAGILSEMYGNQQIAVGIISILVTLFLATPILRRGWTFAASVTPVTALVMTLIFFACLRFGNALDVVLKYFNVTALYLSVTVGILNVVLIKSVKYVLFDPTKEAVYIPLDEETKIRGKAAVDGVGSRLGKSLGSVIISFLTVVMGSGSIANIRTPIVCIIIGVIFLWIVAVRALGKLKAAAEEKHESELKATH